MRLKSFHVTTEYEGRDNLTNVDVRLEFQSVDCNQTMLLGGITGFDPEPGFETETATTGKLEIDFNPMTWASIEDMTGALAKMVKDDDAYLSMVMDADTLAILDANAVPEVAFKFTSLDIYQ